MSDQELARDRAIRELARRLEHIVPASLLADPHAFARQFIHDMTEANTRGAWRYIPTSPGITPPTPNPDAYERGGELARDLLNIRKDQP